MLLSGGVDSSVALSLLRDEGHEVTAFYLKVWLEDELAHLGECPWEEDLSYARAVCAEAGVRLKIVSLQREYHNRVVRWTIEELRAGRTPSPDILCNQHIKFGVFFDALAPELQPFDRVATGHYARLRESATRRELLKGIDPVKDQTYFLFKLDQSQLARSLFPLGALHKREVRRLAHDLDLPNRDRPDSQGICFLGSIRYDEFVRSYLGERPGEIRELGTGRRLGTHRGYWFHTIGQRRGLGLGGGPWYVVGKDPGTNVLTVCHQRDLPHRESDRFHLDDVHWISGSLPGSDRLTVKIRHSPQTYGCRLVHEPDGGLEVRLDEADPGIAAGQAAVLYDGEVCLGGAYIAAPRSLACG